MRPGRLGEHRPALPAGVQLQTCRADRIQIAAHAVDAVRGDEADAGEGAGPAPRRDVGDRAVQPVPEHRGGERDAGTRRQRDAAVDPAQPFGLQRGIGGDRIGADTERPVQLVERRQAPAAIGGRAQRHRRDRRDGNTGPPGPFRPPPLRKDGVGQRRAGGNHRLAQGAVRQPPAIHPPAECQCRRAGGQARVREQAIGQRGAARHAPPRGQRVDVGVQLLRLPGDASHVGAEPQIAAFADRRLHFDAAAGAGGGRVILVERLRCRGPGGIDAGELRREGARLEIGERGPAPVAAPDQADAGVGALAAVAGEGRAAFARVGEARQVGLQFGLSAERDHAACRGGKLLERRRAIGGAAALGDGRHEAVATIVRRRQRGEAAVTAQQTRCGSGERPAAAVREVCGKRRLIGGIGAVDLDRASERAGSEIAAATAARHADQADTIGGIGGEGHPAAERVRLRHAIQDQERAAGRIAADPAQRQPLAGRIGRARIAPAELLQPRDIGEHRFQPAAGAFADARRVDRDDVRRAIARSGGQAATDDDDVLSRRRVGGGAVLRGGGKGGGAAQQQGDGSNDHNGSG